MSSLRVLAVFLFVGMSHRMIAFRHRISYMLPSKHFYRTHRASTDFSTIPKVSNINTKNGNVVDDSVSAKLMSLLGDIREILQTPGMAKFGLTRSLQVARASNKIVLEFLQSKEKYTDSNGQLSVPKTLRRVFEELGATYIKLGQFIASSPTLFPAEYVTEFQACLDKSPTVPYSEIKKIIQEDLAQPVSSFFLSVDPVPLASASIAQVHKAVLRDGTEVVIKVRKPGVDSTLMADLGFLLVASKVIEFINPAVSAVSLSNIVGDIRASMLDELDFKKEAKNLENFRSFLVANGITDATAPKPFPQASGTRVLTMEYLKGVPLVDLEGIRKFTKSPEATLISALRTWAATVATNDVFHADVHAGNLLVLEDGRIGFIDFGIVGKISDSFRNAIYDLFAALMEDNFREVANALVRMGATNDSVDVDRFGAELREVVKKINDIQPELLVEVQSQTGSGPYGDNRQSVAASLVVDERETTELVLEIVNVATRNGLRLPREFGLVLKQALYFDRYQKLLAPSLDPLRDARVRSSFNQEVLNYNRNAIIDVEAIDIK
mmetsp:Transcript_4740/g.6509  ORF Transcript_4740/g.6509 Transcript_4740/m.6509 type:complete len:552 (-) Transcript_4740:731-2386(-)